MTSEEAALLSVFFSWQKPVAAESKDKEAIRSEATLTILN
jgi:hypothetical protein